jgi:hypothetical protein
MSVMVHACVLRVDMRPKLCDSVCVCAPPCSLLTMA